MTIIAAIEAALSAIEALNALVPRLIAQAKAKGELTPEQEADYQSRQAQGFAQPYMQPEPAPPPPAIVPPPDSPL
jgi:hypothetical protein